MSLNQKGAAHLLLLLAGIGVITYIVIAGYTPLKNNLFSILNRKPESQASGGKSDLDLKYNPFGDPWTSKKAPSNQAIAVSLSVPNQGPYVPNSPYSGMLAFPLEQIDYLSKSNAPFLYLDSFGGELQGDGYKEPTYYSRLKGELSQIHAKRPDMKIIGYVVFSEGHLALKEAFENNPGGNKNCQVTPTRTVPCETFMLHKNNSLNPADRIFRSANRPVFDITNPDYRRYMINKWIAAMDDMGFDGVMADGMGKNVLAMRDKDGAIIKDLVPAKAALWDNALGDFAQELKSSMKSKILFGNVRPEESDYVRDVLLAPGRLDGIIIEDPIGRSEDVPNDPGRPASPFYPGRQHWDDLITLLTIASQRDKYAMVIVNANVNCADPSSANCFTSANANEQTRNAQRKYAGYFLAAYLMIYQNNRNESLPSRQMFVLYNQTAYGNQFNSATFYREWDLTLGRALNQAQQPDPSNPGVTSRAFQNGVVYLNSSGTDYRLPSGSGLVSTIDGSPMKPGTIIPARTGRIFVNQATYNNWQPATLNCTNRPAVTYPQSQIKNQFTTNVGLFVAIKPGINSEVKTNSFHSINFKGLSSSSSSNGNAKVTVVNANNVALTQTMTSDFTYQVPGNTDTVYFLVQPKNPGLAATTNLEITDRCGPGLTTFFGAGTNIWKTSPASRASGESFEIKPDFNKTATSMNGTTPSVQLDWYEVPQAGNYNIYRNNTRVGTVSPNTTSYNDTTASPGTSYTYQTAAVVNGQEVKGGAQSVTAPAPQASGPFTLNAPSTFCSGTNSHVKLSWTQPPTNPPRPGIDSGYFVYIDGVYKYNALHALTLDDPEPKVAGRAYKYKIEAVVNPGGRTMSNEQTVVAKDCSTPGSLTLKQPTTFCSGTNSHIRLNWTQPPTNPPRPGIDSGYFIYINGAYKYNALHALNLDDPEPKVPGQTYRYKVEAVVNPGGRTMSNEVAITAANCGGTPAATTRKPVMGDYNGDRKADITVHRPSTAQWFNAATSGAWGARGDYLVPGDYNGDGKNDLAVYRPSNGIWYINGVGSFQWGAPNHDIPVPGDYNGDGKTDIAVFRPSTGYWYSQNGVIAFQWGVSTDIPVPADYNGDGKTDVAVYRPSTGYWYSQNGVISQQWGAPNHDIPIPADYNGDGKADVAVFRPSTGYWYSSNGVLAHQWGVPNHDKPVPADYNGDGKAEIAVFRPSNGYWYILGGPYTAWGAPNHDIPVSIYPVKIP